MRTTLLILAAFPLAVLYCLIIHALGADAMVLRAGISQFEEQTGVSLRFERIDVNLDSVGVRGLRVDLPADAPLRVAAESLEFEPFARRIVLGQTALSYKDAIVLAKGAFRLDRRAGRVALSIPPSSCRDLIKITPSTTRSQLEGVALSGRLTVDVDVAYDEDDIDSTDVSVAYQNGCDIVSLGHVPPPSRYRGPFTYRAYNADRERFDKTTGPSTSSWTPLEDISPYLKHAVVAEEDTLFYRHDGMVVSRFGTALKHNLKASSFRFGASTITMQLAKNLFLERSKTIGRKLQEIFFTWYLERYFTKDEILELYLNVIEFGPNVYGVGPASQHYFGRPASRLNLIESVFLVKLLPSPSTRHRYYETGRISADFRAKMHSLLRKLVEGGRISVDEYHLALAEPLRFHHPGEPPVSPRLTTMTQREILEAASPYSKKSRPRLAEIRYPAGLFVSERDQAARVVKSGQL